MSTTPLPQSPILICFAGAIGSSKSPIANYLSTKIGLPVFNNDNIRTEVAEDLGYFDEQVYLQRMEERLSEIIAHKTSFIYDASADRRWATTGVELKQLGYRWFLISLDLSVKKLTEIWQAKKYIMSDALDKTHADHEKFLQDFGSEVGLHITDETFLQRLPLSLDAVTAWINGIKG